MNNYVKPKSYILQNYIFPVHLQASAAPAPIVPDCAEEGTACPTTTNMGYHCQGSDWLILFELGNASCDEIANPLKDLNCQIVESEDGSVSPTPLQCVLQAPCSEVGCNGGAVYQITCEANSNEPRSCSSNDRVSVSCAINDFENCENKNPI